MQHYTRSIEIAAELSELFAFHTDPSNLLRITPSHVKAKLLRHDEPAEGAEVILRVRPLFFFPQNWRMRFDIFEPPRRLQDVMLSGPFRVWRQTREFVPLANGHTLLNDTVEYELPFAALGRLVDRAYVARQIQEMFAFRQERTKELLEK